MSIFLFVVTIICIALLVYFVFYNKSNNNDNDINNKYPYYRLDKIGEDEEKRGSFLVKCDKGNHVNEIFNTGTREKNNLKTKLKSIGVKCSNNEIFTMATINRDRSKPPPPGERFKINKYPKKLKVFKNINGNLSLVLPNDKRVPATFSSKTFSCKNNDKLVGFKGGISFRNGNVTSLTPICQRS